MDETQRTLVTAVLPPLITAALAALGLWISERRKDRSAAERRRKAIDEENDHITYLKSWLETELLVGGTEGVDAVKTRAEVRRQLTESRARLARAEMNTPQEDAQSAVIRALKKAALVPLLRPAARVVRLCYWSVLGFGLLLLFFATTTDYSDVRAIDVRPSDIFFFSLMITLPFLVVAVLLAVWARALELRQVRQEGDLASTAGSAIKRMSPTSPVQPQEAALPVMPDQSSGGKRRKPARSRKPHH